MSTNTLRAVAQCADFGFFDSLSPEITKKSTEDFLVLSAALYRIKKLNIFHTVYSLADAELLTFVTPQDRIEAAVIRDYYSKKIMLWNLMGVTLTPFQTDMSAFIHSTTPNIAFIKDIKLIYCLPEFYHYSIDLAALQFNKTPLVINQVRNERKTLTPVKYLKRRIKGVIRHEYWLKDETECAYMILIEPRSSLQFLWDREFARESLCIQGAFFPMTYGEVPHYKVKSWNFG